VKETLRLHTEGNKIKNSCGQTVRLTGAGVSILEWGWNNPNQYTNGHWNEEYVQFFKSVGGNSLRLALSCYPFNDSYFSLVDQFVGWCRKHGVYVILDMHMGNPDDWSGEKARLILENPTTPLDQVLGAGYPNVSWIDWLTFYVGRYKNDPTVCGINIFNEPCQEVPVGYTIETFFNLWRNAANLAVNSIQTVNPEILIFLYGMNWGETLAYWNSNPLPQNNLVYCCIRHMQYDTGEDYYNNYITGNYEAGKQDFIKLWTDNKIFEMAGKHPVDFIEWGSQNSPYDPAKEEGYKQWTRDVLDIINYYGMNQHYWVYAGYNANNGDLLKHDDWITGKLTLSDRGLIWSSHLAPLPIPPIMPNLREILYPLIPNIYDRIDKVRSKIYGGGKVVAAAPLNRSLKGTAEVRFRRLSSADDKEKGFWRIVLM